jgi:amino acid permease
VSGTSGSGDDWSSFLSRDELLGGLPARRASTLLFAIESRTAHLVARSRRAMARFLTERTAEEQERVFLDALAQGREPPLQPTLQDLERYALDWAELVPAEPGIRAALARMLGEKYLLSRRQVPQIRRALGLDDDEVRATFERLHDRPLASVYAERLPWRERLRWLRAGVARRLETLPPFWTAFALTLTETVGAGILALPIAFATVGPLAGAVVLLVLGLVNILTIAAMSEAVARNGSVRHGQAYFGRLVTEYLGHPGAWVLTASFLTINTIVLLAYYIGVSSVLHEAIGLPALVGVALLFIVVLAVLRRESLDATVASALLVGAASIGLIVILSLLALANVSEGNLRHSEVPFIGGEPFTAAIVELIFGVVLVAYFGHTSAANCAAVVLRRDPSARTLIWGCVAALGAAMGLYVLWVVAVNGAVAPAALADETGTALGPLADVAGTGVLVFGSVFAVLAMGMASIHMSLGRFNQVREWLPAGPGISARVRFAAGIAPTLLIVLAVNGLLLAGRESFAEPLGFLGAIFVPVIAGMFSMLLLAAGRQKGDYAVGAAWPLLGHPVTLVSIYLLFLGSIALHGLVIWEAPYQRISALLVTIGMAVLPVVLLQRDAFAPRAVVELRLDRTGEHGPRVSVVAAGQAVPAEVMLTWADGRREPLANANGHGRLALLSAQIDLPPSPVRELKVGARRSTPEGNWEALPSQVIVGDGATTREFDLTMSGGQVLLPLADGGGATRRVQILVADSSR